MASFGENLKKIRKEKGLSQDRLAELMDTTRVFVSMYERELRKPKQETIERFASALDCDIWDLEESFTPYELREHTEKEIKEDQQSFLETVFDSLNELGRDKVIDYAFDLRHNPKYNKRTNPNNNKLYPYEKKDSE